jgi:hypothetical protein
MKNILFVIICLFFTVRAQSQSLSAKELVNFFDTHNKTEFLKSRSFTRLGSDVSEKGVTLHFDKNTGTSKQETLTVGSTTLSYFTRNKDYINNLLAQLQRQYKQTVKDDDADFSYYLFAAGGSKKISVNISKTGAKSYTIGVIDR